MKKNNALKRILLLFVFLSSIQLLFGAQPPTLIYPRNGATMDNGCKQPGEKIIWDFDWSDIPGATKYQLYVIGGNATIPAINVNTVPSRYHHENAAYIIERNRYNWKWKVRALVNGAWTRWSATRSFNVEKMCSDVSQPATPPALISPRNGATMDNGCREPGEKTIWDFDWADVSGATLYNLYVMGPNAKYPMINRNISTSKYHHESLGFVADFNRNNWTWKVRAQVNGVWSNWSTSRSFNVEKMCSDVSQPATPPALLSPQNGTTMDNGCREPGEKIIWDFDWADVPGATLYNLYVMGPNAKYPMINRNISTSKYHNESSGLIADFNRNNWTWKVRAQVNGVWSNWSTSRSFNVEKMCLDTLTEIEVTSPKANEEFCLGKNLEISWKRTGIMDDQVKITLFRRQKKQYTIISSTANDGNFSWTIPKTVTPGSYSVIIRTLDGKVAGSIRRIRVSGCAGIEVTSPKSDEEICLGKNMQISWKRTGVMDDRVKITLFRRKEKQYTISSSTANDGNFSWTVPKTVTPGSYSVIIRTLDGKVAGSIRKIRVSGCAGIEVTSPKANEEFCLGKNLQISWKRTGVMDDRVKITLFRRQKKQYIIISSTANDGNFSWTIPKTVTPTSYQVIVRTLDGKVSGSTKHIRVLDCNK